MALALQDLERIDYWDAYRARASRPVQRSAEEWARAALESLPRPAEVLWRAAWSLAGLRAGPRSSCQHVLGLGIGEKAADAILLKAPGRSVTVQLALLVDSRNDPPALVLSTFAQRRGWLGKATWAVISRLHRRVAPYLLERAVTR
ncbi:MAG: DUF2867 domain-containing protein [Chloroflexi bacterium]|nr:MAG: DUF2867 domain-containing protein [Chloroflexota bacterium]